ncbi:hypothetical protein CVIRNUC_003045 [Coccomyxa viridis]|uniref:Sialidase domain-containing protein n=1 Tax=Coccomyxa viridis TaxID=1274662 RepID=A0AAV1I161_9CHLO|nr:hypothetical protein CVIRNUC_003045 [Coccomyxa viridis]
MHLPRAALLCLCILSQRGICSVQARPQAQTSLTATYRWIYRNPMAGVTDKAAAVQAQPGALLYSHMGMLATLPNGSLAAAWQGAPKWWEGSDEQGIHWAISDDGGASWGAQQALVPAPDGLPAWGPVLYSDGKEAGLFYAVSRRACWWQGEGGMHWACGGDIWMQRLSSGSEASWTSPKVIYSFSDEGGIAKMLANRLGTRDGGGWMLPVWREMGGQQACNTHPELHGAAGVLLSDDQGSSWRVANISLDTSSQPTWLIEGAVARTGRSSWFQVFRTSVGFMYSSRSGDDGLSWTPAKPTHVRNPNSKVDLLALEPGILLLAYNDDSEASRSTLVLAMSTDKGILWHDIAILESDPAGSFHYPTLMYQEEQDTVLVIYSVDFLPDELSSRATSSQGENSTRGGLQWSCELCCVSHEATLGAVT